MPLTIAGNAITGYSVACKDSVLTLTIPYPYYTLGDLRYLTILLDGNKIYPVHITVNYGYITITYTVTPPIHPFHLSPYCNHSFGDNRCLATTRLLTVTCSGRPSDTQIQCAQLASYPTDYWKYGYVTYGNQIRIITSSSGTSALLTLDYTISMLKGEIFTIQRGCNKTYEGCKKRPNFGGYKEYDDAQYYIWKKAYPG